MYANGSTVATAIAVSELAPIVTAASMRRRTPSSATQIESRTGRICAVVAQLLAAIGPLPAGDESLPDDATLRHPLRRSCGSQGLVEIRKCESERADGADPLSVPRLHRSGSRPGHQTGTFQRAICIGSEVVPASRVDRVAAPSPCAPPRRAELERRTPPLGSHARASEDSPSVYSLAQTRTGFARA